MKKIVSILTLFSLVSVMVLPAFASSDTEFVQKSSFWHWLNDQGGIVSGIVAYGLGRVCVNSDDGYHRSSSYAGTNIFGEYVCECDYCGHKFTTYESDLKQSYDNQVADMRDNYNTTTINKDGYSDLILSGWYYNWSDGKRQIELNLRPYDRMGIEGA